MDNDNQSVGRMSRANQHKSYWSHNNLLDGKINGLLIHAAIFDRYYKYVIPK